MNPFCGTFLGGGHTITADISNDKHQGTALFAYIKDATIKNLTVAGNVTACQPYTAGIVGFADGTNLIEACNVTAVLNIRSDYAGGIVGNGQASATTVKDCIFAGSVTGIASARANVGGIYGWCTDGATPALQNCMEKGTYTNIASMHPIGLQDDKGTISQCYYLNPMLGTPAQACTVKGAYLVGPSALDGEISRQVRLTDGATYYTPCVISSLDEFYELAQGSTLSINPTVTLPDGTALTYGSDYTATLDNQTLAAANASVTTKGEHTLVVSGKGNYIGSKSFTFKIFEPIAGKGTAEEPYLIRNTDEWNLLATLVNRGDNAFAGQYVQLNADMSVTTIVGATAAKPFKGTFLGGGRTLTFSAGSPEAPFGEIFCAPFGYVDGATIRNLKVAGDIYSYKMRAAGLVGSTAGTTTIADCNVSTVIHSSTSGDGSHGGIVGMPSGELNITDCIYSGRILTTNGTAHCGGFVGWHNGQTIKITSSLYAPDTSIAAAEGETDVTVGATFVRGTDVGTDCFYTQNLDALQGTKVYTEALANELCMKAKAADDKWYYLPVTVSGINPSYMLHNASLSIEPNVTGYGDTNPAITTDFKATLNGTATAFPISITGSGSYTLVLAAVEGSEGYTGSKTIEFVVSQPLAGEGTKENPYLVRNEADWDLIATKVADGEAFSGMFLKLNADISVSTMMGTNSAHAFMGTFDGDSHTLTFTTGSAEAPFNEEFCAPFRYVNGATIHDLKVGGNIYTSMKFAAGLVAATYGSTTITGCQVGTVVHSTLSGDGSHGGIVGMPSGALTIENSIYDGRLLTTAATTHCAGFVGWANGQTISLTNLLYAPAAAIADGETAITDGATFMRGGNAGDHCYYTAPLGEAQGIQVYATRPEGELCMQATAADGKQYYLPCTVGGVLAAYDQEGDFSITPTVTGLAGAALTFNTDFTATLDGKTVEAFPITTTERGDHTLILAGAGDNYSGSKTIQFTVTAALTGNGSEAQPYLISSTSDWTLFATKVAGGMDYSGKYVRLDADIAISKPVGERGDKPFSGIFLGAGHTLTADIANTDAGAQGAAPFRYIKDATIQNLKVAGTIASNSRHTAGLVGFADGTNTIGQCVVTATLNVASDYAAGLVAAGLSSTTTITGCIFAGTINGLDGKRSNMAGIWGLGGTPTLQDCMEKGTYTNVGSMHPMGLQSADGTITGCYYLTPQTGEPDHACTVSGAYQVSTTATEGEICKSVTAVDNATYYMPCTVSGLHQIYYNASADVAITIPAPTITAADGTVLAAETDFAYTTNPATVKEAGNYTLTVTAQGSYTGTKTMSFAVSNDKNITSSTTFLSSGEYRVYEDVTIDSRRTISGDVVLNLGEGTKLTSTKGIELSKGNTLTINGKGSLIVDGCDEDKSAIGAVEVGTLVINDGDVIAKGGKYAAGIGGDKNNISGGSITINGGIVHAVNTGLDYAPGIGGGYDDQVGHYGVCGDIVINGGQVKSMSFNYGFGQGEQAKDVDQTTYTSGSLTLGWSKPDDYVYDFSFSSYFTKQCNVNSFAFAPGKKFLLKDTQTVATAENIGGRTITPLLAPTNNGDNSALISSCNGMKLPVMLDGRTLYKDGAWNTICLPFNVAISGSPLAGAIARPLTAARLSDDKTTINLTFGEAVTELVAGTPYIIKWQKADDYVDDDAHNIVSPMFASTAIDAEDRSYDNGESADSRVRFVGTYNGMAFNAKDYSVLFMGGANTLYYPTSGAGIGAQRAYFRIGDDATAGVRQLSVFNIDFGYGEETAIGEIVNNKSSNSNSDWFSIDGRKVANGDASRRKLPKGVYIHDGRKVIVGN